MPMESREERYYTPEEYLTLEDAALEKHEYYDGRIYAMTGATLNHAQITMNVQLQLGMQLRGRPCRLFNTDVKVLVSETGLYTYPDASALCGEPRFQEADSAILLNPSVIVEVLSPSTESYDRGEKYTHYKRVPSLREYVLVAQDRVRVERRTRGDDAAAEWGLSSVEDLDAVIGLPSIGCTLALRDVYEHVELPPRPPLRAVYEQAAQYAANF
jgi:Uma2 family endonuclease